MSLQSYVNNLTLYLNGLKRTILERLMIEFGLVLQSGMFKNVLDCCSFCDETFFRI